MNAQGNLRQRERYLVTIVGVSGAKHRFSVATRLSKYKAAAVAGAIHSSQNQGDPIFEVSVRQQSTWRWQDGGYTGGDAPVLPGDLYDPSEDA
jgi:hypothetical protein